MPPTKYKTGNIFKGHVQDTLFNAVSIMTNQGIQLLGMLTEAIHTPFLQDRALSIENAKYVFSTMKDLGSEIEFKQDGMIQKRAQKVLSEAVTMLKEIEEEGLTNSISKGKFAEVKRTMTSGKGLEGVIKKDAQYFNPFIDLMLGGQA
jgi:beta-lysine 5,6-aminomutase alpha subunit